MATGFSIGKFKSALAGGGARPNLFEVRLTSIPGGVTWDSDNFKFMCKAASLPAQTIANIDVPFRGRIFKVAGDRTIENWTLTIINDEDFKYRTAFEGWMQHILRLENNTGTTNPVSYMTNADVIQLGRGSQVESTNSTDGSYDDSANGTEVAGLARYQMQDIWPVNVSSIDLSMDNSDQIEEFTVEFAVQSFSRMASVDT
jgi:hypothetical protein